MARHYSPKSCFRQMSSELLNRYFDAKAIATGVDLSALQGQSQKRLFDAWLAIPELTRREMDAELREIFAMSCEKGFRAILDEAAWRLVTLGRDAAANDAFVAKLSGLANHFERAMVAFLDHRELWLNATLFYHADTLPYWRKRKNLPHGRAAVDNTALQNLARLISDYFHRTEGRGSNCIVEPLRRGDLDYFFAYPEDYSQQAVEWVNGKFARRPHNPAFEVIYVYSQTEGTLDLNVRGARKCVEQLQSMFATAILNLPGLPPDPKDDRVYDLNPLSRRGFSFVFDSNSGIRSMAVRMLRLSSKFKHGDRITLEADTTRDHDAVYSLLETIGKALPLDLYYVTQVELVALMARSASEPTKAMTIRITHPNSCSLKYEDADLLLRDTLRASGIEPKPQQKEEAQSG
jgi:hypothetical protein